ncbi:MAG TPA: dephospho-CoA kinase [Brevefilum sp.]|nr:dephospho-CoA kinase [Brevefilum sp.]HOR19969.1 dephospho-CoA kinase [Brevefilum sp.]HPL70297.1 dephospho-CoA kinase [Brevefilum sp.]
MIDSSFIIGITGNIATGKSVIRHMLANAGLFGLDADSIANRMLYPGTRSYQQVLDTFGPEIKTEHGQISNKKLGQIVFNDLRALEKLEALVHPEVTETIYNRIQTAGHPVVSIEAIKLIEAGLSSHCDKIWVSYASVDHQMRRLRSSRALTNQEARARINSQPPQIDKFARADVIINTETTFKDTWLRTQRALNDTIQSINNFAPLHINISKDWFATSVNSVPATQLERAWKELTRQSLSDLYESLGSKMVLTLSKNEHIQAFILWESWNFSGTLYRVFPGEFFDALPSLVFNAFEKHAQFHQVEILLVANKMLEAGEIHPEQFAFNLQLPAQITYPAWQIAAQKAVCNKPTSIWHKVLAQPFESINAV